MKQQYTIWEQTPLKWHKFEMYFRVPFGILTSVIGLSTAVETLAALKGTSYQWLGVVDILYIVFVIATSIAAEIGLVQRKRFGPAALLSVYAGSAFYAVFSMIVGGFLLNNFGVSVGQRLGAVIVYFVAFLLVRVYYRKRMPLFTPADRVPVVAPAHRPELAQTDESSVRLLEQLRDEADAERAVQAPERRVYGPLDPPEPRKGAKGGAPVWLTVVLLCACLALAVACGLMGVSYGGVSAERDSLTLENEELRTMYEGLQEEHKVVKAARERLFDQVMELQWAQDDLEWYENAVGFTVLGDLKYYHKRDCGEIAGKDYWINNVEACEYMGYVPCPKCH